MAGFRLDSITATVVHGDSCVGIVNTRKSTGRMRSYVTFTSMPELWCRVCLASVYYLESAPLSSMPISY